MKKDDFDKARSLISGMNELKSILLKDSNNPGKVFKESITLPTSHMREDILELVKSTIEKLEKELEAL